MIRCTGGSSAFVAHLSGEVSSMITFSALEVRLVICLTGECATHPAQKVIVKTLPWTWIGLPCFQADLQDPSISDMA